MTAVKIDDRLTVDGRLRAAKTSFSHNLSNPGRDVRHFHFSAMSVAPAPRTGAAEWYNHFDHFDMRPQQNAAFVMRQEPVTQMASGDVENGKAARLLSGDAKPVVASLGPSARDARPVEVLAYADPSPKAEGGALAALNAAAGLESDDGEPDESDMVLVPENVPLPVFRPEPPVAAKPEKKQDTRKEAEKPEAAEQADKVDTPDRAAALSRPDIQGEQDDSSPGFLKKLFTPRPRAGSGIAVYDISAAKVYMPDGSVLEAASGIGKMANNPKYVHVKMNGPTPPHTYNLRMREKRFHGVEAIRMLPVDGKNKYGRDGFLAHTQLLRGRPGQSHGCVAFKDYNKFLRAFKQGKVKQMIVVSGGGAGVFARASAKGGDV